MNDDGDDLDRGDPFADAGAVFVRQQAAKKAGAGEGMTAERRKAGRPRGSLNRKTQDFTEFYQARGYKDPLEAMAEFITADPVELHAWFQKHEPDKKKRPSVWAIIGERNTLASQLAPYLHGKKPLLLDMGDGPLPHITIELRTNQLDEAAMLIRRNALSLGDLIEGDVPEENSSENKELEDEPE